ncbi:MAG: class I SAM-dependent methyltransferase [Salinarimonas sp.]
MSATQPVSLHRKSLDAVERYYTQPRDAASDSPRTIYAIWEEGGAFNDSITPSTHCPEYRSHMRRKMLLLTGEGARVFSFGCGNAFIEADLVESGRVVTAMDCNAEAVGLAAAKGIDAFRADYFDLPADTLSGVDLVYADGFLGHVFDENRGLEPFFEKLDELGLTAGAHFVISNDAPMDPTERVAPHPRVDDFWFLSRSYLREALATRGFECLESYYFPYMRPQSGLRNRTICVARAGALGRGG